MIVKNTMINLTAPDDYIAARTTSALFDTSSTAKLLLTGPDAPTFLHNISTNDINSLPLGGGCEAFLCDARAKVLFNLVVYHVLHGGQHALWVETASGRNEDLLKYLDRYLISEAVELSDITGLYRQCHLAGPKSRAVLEAALGARVPDLQPFEHMERTFGSSGHCNIRRRDLLGEVGFDLVALADKMNGIERMLTAAGAVSGTPQTLEVLRIEAGTPLFGVDFDDNRFVMEVGHAARAVSYAKGCFPGQEPIVMARDRAGRINRSFLGLKLSQQAAVGEKLLADGQEVGQLTSVTLSPHFQGWLGLGYVHWKHTATDTVLSLASGGTATVIGYPPYKSAI